MPSPVLLHINCRTGFVKRYVRGGLPGKVTVTHKATITPGVPGLQDVLEQFRSRPQSLADQQNPPKDPGGRAA